MNLVQKKYLCNRIDDIAAAKTASITEPEIDAKALIVGELTHPKGMIETRFNSKIIAKKIRISTSFQSNKISVDGYVDIADLLNIPEKLINKINGLLERRTEKLSKRTKDLRTHVASLKDNIMFGNDKDALDAIKAFKYSKKGDHES